MKEQDLKTVISEKVKRAIIDSCSDKKEQVDEAVRTTTGQKIKSVAKGTAVGALTAALGIIGTGSVKASTAFGAAAGTASALSSQKKYKEKNEKRVAELQGMIDRGEDLLRKWRAEGNQDQETKDQISKKEAQLRKWKAEISKLEK